MAKWELELKDVVLQVVMEQRQINLRRGLERNLLFVLFLILSHFLLFVLSVNILFV